MTSMRVRRIGSDEAAALRDIRLRALADAPLAFASTHAREAAYPSETWETRARDAASGPRRAIFFAVDADDAPVGLAMGVVERDGSDVAHLYAMWVAPEARGAGAGRAIVEATVAWASDQGAARIRTAVTVGNEAALRLYERAGFRDTGAREPLGHSDAGTAVLERVLEPGVERSG
jgi:ribosomal protein S18 acetylase RimI-like enzyme